jgi:hypothetical protein
LRGLTSSIGCFARLLCSLESSLGGGMLRPCGTASPGVLLPEGVLFREIRAVLEYGGGPLVDACRMLGYLERTSTWGFSNAGPHVSRYSYYVLNRVGRLTPAAPRPVNRRQLCFYPSAVPLG